MKKIIPALIILSFVCKACKKDAVDHPDNNVLGTLSAKIDGDTKNFNAPVKAVQESSQNPYKIRIVGYKRPGSLTNMEITIVSANPIVPGTYNNDTYPNSYVRIVYYEEYYPFGISHDSWEYLGSGRTGSVTISEISNSSVKGTFSGTLFYSDFVGTDLTNTLSNGMFNASF